MDNTISTEKIENAINSLVNSFHKEHIRYISMKDIDDMADNGISERDIAYAHSDKKWNDDIAVYELPFCSYGDYDNSCAAERANYREMVKTYAISNIPGFILVSGGYDYHAIYYVPDIVKELSDDDIANMSNIANIIRGLYNYPVIDDQTMSEIEEEIFAESWENCYASDFAKQIEKLIGYDLDFSKDHLRQIWHKFAEEQNQYPEVEAGGNGHFPKVEITDKQYVIDSAQLPADIKLAVFGNEDTKSDIDSILDICRDILDCMDYVDNTPITGAHKLPGYVAELRKLVKEHE